MATVRTGAAFAFLAAFAMSAYAEPIANQSRSQMKLAQDKDKDVLTPNALPAARCMQDCDNAAEIAVPKWSAAALVGCKARC